MAPLSSEKVLGLCLVVRLSGYASRCLPTRLSLLKRGMVSSGSSVRELLVYPILSDLPSPSCPKSCSASSSGVPFPTPNGSYEVVTSAVTVSEELHILGQQTALPLSPITTSNGSLPPVHVLCGHYPTLHPSPLRNFPEACLSPRSCPCHRVRPCISPVLSLLLAPTLTLQHPSTFPTGTYLDFEALSFGGRGSPTEIGNIG